MMSIFEMYNDFLNIFPSDAIRTRMASRGKKVANVLSIAFPQFCACKYSVMDCLPCRTFTVRTYIGALGWPAFS